MERKTAADFPQELLDLFDQYVHGGISRRQFLEGAQKFAVGGATAAALFQMLKPNYAWATQVPQDDKRIRAVPGCWFPQKLYRAPYKRSGGKSSTVRPPVTAASCPGAVARNCSA
ncbi:MAG: twin-arginine translocation signal domain-containing protein [Stellaceae bacterium]